MGKIISFSNQKGGVGKTTSCVNVSAYCALAGKKVLLIDLDPQGNATTSLGVSKGGLKKTVYNVLIEEEPIVNAIRPTMIEGLKLLPANIDLAGAESELVYKRGRELTLKRALEPIVKSYDFIFIDCPPSLGLLSVNALAASDSALVPVQCEYFALEGLTQLMNSVSLVRRSINKGLQLEGVLRTMYDGRSLIAKQVSDELKKYFGDQLYEIVIPRNVRLAEAPSHGVPIALHDDKCAGAKAYKAFTEEFLEKTDEK